jgi:hypothetical protein
LYLGHSTGEIMPSGLPILKTQYEELTNVFIAALILIGIVTFVLNYVIGLTPTVSVSLGMVITGFIFIYINVKRI